MRKAADLSKFDNGQIVMDQRFETSISKAAQLVGCSRLYIINIYAEGINGDERSKNPKLLNVLASSKKKRTLEILPLQCVQEHVNWTLDKCKRVDRSDEL
ncbi:hypothetical protein TNCV_3119491 [Trichonephila clavipes]|uniref:Uncharacterized protein n=1 Tax=Trichonephila clavipes TaxID=2585209 RepID=A0A8X6W9P3_TRICX|nr:hypothetical protein TNCV_3119491 [Trichonephila clavipes]